MKAFLPLLAIAFFISGVETPAQNPVPANARRNCAHVSRPIIDIGGGMVIGKALKIAYPRLNDTTKRFAQKTTVSVRIQIDENGRVISAEAGKGVPVLQKLSEEAARETRFSPTMVDGQPIRIKARMIYKFERGAAAVSYSLDPVEIKEESAPNPSDGLMLSRMFDSKIVAAIFDFRAGKSLEPYAFIKDGRAAVQLCMQTKTPAILERIAATGFELLEETNGDGLAGRIVVEKLDKLAAIEEIRFIVPETP